MAVDTVAQLLATAENPPPDQPLGPPYNSEDGYTCFDAYLAIGGCNGNPNDVPNLAYLQANPQPGSLSKVVGGGSVTNVTNLAFVGATVSGVSPQATITIPALPTRVLNNFKVTSARLLALAETPVTLIAAVAGYAIQVVSIATQLKGTKYTTGVGAHVYIHTGAGYALADAATAITSADNAQLNIYPGHIALTANDLVADTALTMTNDGADYTVGTGDLYVTIVYNLITIN